MIRSLQYENRYLSPRTTEESYSSSSNFTRKSFAFNGNSFANNIKKVDPVSLPMKSWYQNYLAQNSSQQQQSFTMGNMVSFFI